jgi:hypothetical protein
MMGQDQEHVEHTAEICDRHSDFRDLLLFGAVGLTPGLFVGIAWLCTWLEDSIFYISCASKVGYAFTTGQGSPVNGERVMTLQ